MKKADCFMAGIFGLVFCINSSAMADNGLAQGGTMANDSCDKYLTVAEVSSALGVDVQKTVTVGGECVYYSNSSAGAVFHVIPKPSIWKIMIDNTAHAQNGEMVSGLGDYAAKSADMDVPHGKVMFCKKDFLVNVKASKSKQTDVSQNIAITMSLAKIIADRIN